MALTYQELESITNDYFLLDGGKAVDIYFDDSFALTHYVKQKNGIWERPDGGEQIRIPIEFDRQIGGWYGRGDTLSSDDRESVNTARYDWKHLYGNATIRRIDELKNSGDYAKVRLLTQRLAGAQKSVTIDMANSFYSDTGASSDEFDGVLAMCNETSTTAYGDIAEDDLVASDGTKPWEGKRKTTTEGISLAVIRTLCSDAKIRSGKHGKPNIIFTTESLWNTIADIVQVSQRITEDIEAAKIGFTSLIFEGKRIVADDYCPSGYMVAINDKFFGAAFHKKGLYERTKWEKIPDSPGDRSMKIFCDGNLVCSNRKAHKAHSNLS